MAEVFVAEATGELGFARKVAIKRMLPDAAAVPSAAQRFLDEARIASRLHHAAIVGVLDVGVLDGMPFQVLELVEGLDAQALQQRAGGVVPLEVALALAIEVARGLAFAHAATGEDGAPLGIVHRDVKASNVFVAWSGDVKLGDFGIALARDRTTRTEAGFVPGTAGYMAPEHRRDGVVDGRADVFALALTLCALVTGDTPLRDVAAEAALQLGTPLAMPASIPADLAGVLARGLAPEAAARSSAAQLARELAGVLSTRTARDPRDLVREWIAGFRPVREAAVGALDALLGIEVVVEAAAVYGGHDGPDEQAAHAGRDGHGVPRYRTVARAADAASPEIEASPPTGVTVVDHAPAAARRPRRRGAILAGLGLAALLAGGAVWATRGHARSAAAPVVASVPEPVIEPVIAPVSAPADAAAGPDSLAIVVAVIADADPLPVPDPTLAVLPDARLAKHGRDSDVPTRVVDTAPLPDARPARLATEHGWLLVYGEALVGARAVVDGTYSASPPTPLELPVGHHSVRVELRDGAALPAKPIDITTFHTRAHPLRLTW